MTHIIRDRHFSDVARAHPCRTVDPCLAATLPAWPAAALRKIPRPCRRVREGPPSSDCLAGSSCSTDMPD
jgi:hypothetical protein